MPAVLFIMYICVRVHRTNAVIPSKVLPQRLETNVTLFWRFLLQHTYK